MAKVRKKAGAHLVEVMLQPIDIAPIFPTAYAALIRRQRQKHCPCTA